MSRWILIWLFSLALASGAMAQMDDLDALLAGLGDETTTEEVTPATDLATESAPETLSAADPFADLLGEMGDDMPAPADDLAGDLPEADPFADLLGEMPGDAEPLESEEAAPAELPMDDPFADLLGEQTAADAVPPAQDDSWAAPPEEDPFGGLPESSEEDRTAPEAGDDDLLVSEPAADMESEPWEMDDETLDSSGDMDIPDDAEDLPDPAVSGEEEILSAPEALPETPAAKVQKSKDTDKAMRDAAPAEPKADKKTEESQKPERRGFLRPKVADKPPEWSEPVVW